MRALTLTILLWASVAFPATYYVSNTGSDANNGTSPATPWQTVLKVDATTFSPGDVILWNGGDNFEGPFLLRGAGTLGNPITIASYGTGKGSIYGDHSNAVWSAVGGFPGIYSTTLSPVNSVEYVADFNGTNYNKNNKGAQTVPVWLGTFVATNWGFNSPTVYVKTWDGNPPPQMHLFEFDCVELNKDYVTITNMDIRASHHGLLSEGNVGYRAAWNTIHDTENIGIFLGNSTGPDVGSNTVTRTGEDAIYLSTVTNAFIHDNSITFVTNNVLGIPLKNTHVERCGIAMQQGVYNTNKYNVLASIEGAFFDYFFENGSEVAYNYGFHANGGAFPNGTGLKLHHNIFNLDFAGPGMNPAWAFDPALSMGPDLGANNVFNNVFFNFTSYGCFGSGGSNTVVRNNLFVSTNTTAFQAELTTGANLDYNLYFSTAASTRWQLNGVNYTSLAAWQAGSGQDAHSVYGNPLFVTPTPVTAQDFRIQANSPARRAGIMVDSSSDYNGVPFVNPPSIGAFSPSGFFVLTNGNDSSDGLSPATAWKTLTKAVSSAGTNTVIVGAGTYTTSPWHLTTAGQTFVASNGVFIANPRFENTNITLTNFNVGYNFFGGFDSDPICWFKPGSEGSRLLGGSINSAAKKNQYGVIFSGNYGYVGGTEFTNFGVSGICFSTGGNSNTIERAFIHDNPSFEAMCYLWGQYNNILSCVVSNNNDVGLPGSHPDLFQSFFAPSLGQTISNCFFINNDCQFGSLQPVDGPDGGTYAANAGNWLFVNNIWINQGSKMDVDFFGMRFENNTFYNCNNDTAEGQIFGFNWSIYGYGTNGVVINNLFAVSGSDPTSASQGWFGIDEGTNTTQKIRNSLTVSNNYVVGAAFGTKTTNLLVGTNWVNGGNTKFLSAPSSRIHALNLLGTTSANQTTNVFGTNTSFTTQLAVGDYITVGPYWTDSVVQVVAILNSTNLWTAAPVGRGVSTKFGGAQSIQRSQNFDPVPDLRLLQGSLAINAGANLATIPFDFVGVSRPTGGTNYTIGAYEGPTAEVVPTNMLLHITYNNWNGGSNALDSTSYHSDAALFLGSSRWATPGTGPDGGNSAAHIGDNQYMGITNVAQLKNRTSGTVAVWAQRTNGVGNGYGYILDTGFTFPCTNGWTLGADNGQPTHLYVTGPNNARNTTLTWNDFHDTNYHHYAFSWSNSFVIGYYDGVPFQTNALPAAVLTLDDANWICIGAIQHNELPGGPTFPNAAFLLGNMTDIRIYSNQLSASDILNIYYVNANPRPPTPGGGPSGGLPPQQLMHLTFQNWNGRSNVLDTTSNHSDGIATANTNGPTLATGPFGTNAAGHFADNQWLAVTNVNTFEVLTNGTVSAWINYDNPVGSGDYYAIDGWYAFPDTNCFWLAAPNGSQTQFRTWRNSGSFTNVLYSDWAVRNAWHLYTVTWNGTSIVRYYDGVPASTNVQTIPFYHVEQSTKWLALGVQHGSHQKSSPTFGWLNGSLADIRMYNFALPPSSVARLYQFLDPAIHVAASCSQSDVQAAINISVPGETVLVPFGTCDWTTNVITTNGITIAFQGTTITDSIINTGDTSASSCLAVNVPASQAFPTIISGVVFQPGSRSTQLFESGNINISGSSTQVRIYNCVFNASKNIGVSWSDCFGVFDHNVWSNSASANLMKIHHGNYGYSGGFGDGAWALPSWTNSNFEDGAALYIENNVLTNRSGAGGLGIDADKGARFVVRSNILDRIIIGGNGMDTNGRARGTRVKDVYNNVFVNHGDAEVGHWRSGSGIAATNTILNSVASFTVQNYRMAYGGFWKYANGTNVWDVNDPTIYGAGIATAGGSLTMSDSTATWTPHAFIARTIRNVGTGRSSIVVDNTATTLTFFPSADSPTSDLSFSAGNTYEIRRVITVMDEVGRGQGLAVSNATPVIAGVAQNPQETLDPVWNWGNTLNGGAMTLTNSGYYSSVVGQEIRNAINPNWRAFQYPHPLVSGTNAPTVPVPIITAQPQSTNIYVAQTALFTITVTSQGTPAYQWRTNGVNAGTNGPALSVGPAPIAWSGMSVICIVTNASGTTTSATATLTVLPDPVINTQPANATVGVGAVAHFSVTATGQTTLSYVWKKNGSTIGGATASNYNTPATVSGDNNSQFAVVVTDTAGSLTSANATLTVVDLPVITSQPQSTNIFATQSALFRVTATGGTLRYFWQTNGVATGTNGPALAVGPAPVAWSGMTVACVVSNLAGTVTSSTATLTVGADPVISVQPANATVAVGATANFSVTASGQTAITYQWKKNGSTIAGATLSAYTTPATIAGDNNSQFFVTVTDTAGSLQSANATLTVTGVVGPDPLITLQPQSTNVFATQPATFAVTATGGSTLHYQWKTNGVNTGTDSASLILASCPAAWSGISVLCVVTDLGPDSPVTSSTATLTVSADPVITVQPVNQTVNVGSTAAFSVTATGQTSLTYQWSKNGSLIGGATLSAYTTPVTVPGDNNAQFFVVVTDTAGSLQSATATLTVTNIITPDPQITAQPQSTNIFATQSSLFSLTGAGNSPLSYQWQTNGVNAGTNGPALSLASCPAVWSGMTVLCVLSDSAGSVTSSVATLTIGADPVIGTQPQNAAVFVGQTAGFIVSATGQTALSYQWSRNGSSIAGATLSTYTTPALAASNNGDFYFADVTDSAGTLRSATATLSVSVLPPPPSTNSIARVTNLRVNLLRIGP